MPPRSQTQPGRPRSGTAGTAGTRAPARSAATRPAAAKAQPKAPRALQIGAQSARAAQRETGHGSFAQYQGIILAEFIAAELLVAATPIATRPNTPGLSPYVPRDMTKLLAIGLVYFLLELGAVAGPGAGRLGAWFGGLILIVVGLNESVNVAKILNIFGAGETGSSDGGGSSLGGGQGGGTGGSGKK